MIMLSIWLIALHMLGDYVLQTPYMAANKFKSAAVRSVHVLLYSLPLGLFAGVWVRLHGLPVWHSAAFLSACMSRTGLRTCDAGAATIRYRHRNGKR